MKRCPHCNKEYSDETIQFCLADGVPLSAPYDSQITLLIEAGDILSEARTKFSSELFRLYCLYGYESDGRRVGSLWGEFLNPPGENKVPRDFNAWLRTKRKFSVDELVSRNWRLIRDGEEHGGLITFYRDGRFTKPPIYGNDEGLWELIDGALQMHLDIGRTDYRYYIIASERGLHSGIEHIEDDMYAHIVLCQGQLISVMPRLTTHSTRAE